MNHIEAKSLDKWLKYQLKYNRSNLNLPSQMPPLHVNQFQLVHASISNKKMGS